MLTNLNCNLFFRKILCHRSCVRFLLQEIKRFLQAKKELHHGFWNGDSHYRPRIFLFKVSTRNTKNTRQKCEVNSDICDIGLRSLMLTFIRFHTFIWSFLRWHWASKCWLSRRIMEWNLLWTRALAPAHLHKLYPS